MEKMLDDITGDGDTQCHSKFCRGVISKLQNRLAKLEEEAAEMKAIVSSVRAILEKVNLNSSSPSAASATVDAAVCHSSLQSADNKNLISTPSSTFDPSHVSTPNSKSPILGGGVARKKCIDLDETYFAAAEEKTMSAVSRPSLVNTPKKNPSYAYVGKTVRGNKRKLLRGFTCSGCAAFFKAASLGEQDVQKCSRHRAMHSPVKTPPGYWDPMLPPTQVMLEKQLAPTSDDEL